MFKSILPLAVSLVFFISSYTVAEGINYQTPVGADWCEYLPANALCCEGTEQSPIDIVPSEAKYDKGMPELDIDYTGMCTLYVHHNGHTIHAKVPENSAELEIGEVEYELLQFHFHVPSEHTQDGKQYEMEMHLVHKSADGELAVIGVFIEQTPMQCASLPVRDTLKWAFSWGYAASNERSRLWEAFPTVAGATSVVEDFRLKVLLPRSKKSFRYAGSLTTPPCSEGVAWNVLGQPIAMYRGQIVKFRQCLYGVDTMYLHPEGNARPVQPLEGREVATDVKP